jgi:hypothetical protein
MLKGVVSFFIVLIKLPRHVSASKCHLQGVTRFSFLLNCYINIVLALILKISRKISEEN